MKFRAGVFIFACGTAIASTAQVGGVALEDSQRELKVLQAVPNTKTSIPTNAELTANFAQLPTVGVQPTPLNRESPQRVVQELKERKSVDKNWLVNGVNALERAAHPETANLHAADNLLQAEPDSAREHTAAPNLLEIYGNQQAPAPVNSASKHATVASRDPLAPFLQGWLADSPVRGLFFDDYVKKINTEEATVSSSHNSATAQSGEPRLVTNERRTRPHQTEANPYLSPVNIQALQNPVMTSNQVSLSDAPGNFFRQEMPAGPIAEALPGSRAREKPSARLIPSDAHKYFPQQRKF